MVLRRVADRVNRFVDVPSLDPDDARRRKMLNVTVFGCLALLVLFQAAVLYMHLTATYPSEDIGTLQVSIIVALVYSTIVLLVNRYGSGKLAAVLFLLLALGVATLSDEPHEVVDGRSLMWYAVPIIGGSMLVFPAFSFVMATLSGVAIALVGMLGRVMPTPIGMVGFYVIALFSWLTARTMERAIRDLRILNVELDQRVRNRTRELAETLAKNQAILDSTADGVVFFDRASKAVVANPAMAALMDLPAEEILGHDVKQLLGYDEEMEDGRAEVASLVSAGGASDVALKFPWGAKTLSTTVAPVRVEPTEESIGTVAVFRDFTHEAEIDRMKSTFVSIASHELRTPLNAIMGYTEMLQEGVYGELTDQQLGAMDRLMSNTGHMLGLVNNLLDRARMEAGTLELNIAPFSPAELVTGVQGVMELMAQSKGLRLTTHVADDVPAKLVGDWQRLHQILINLTGNAIKFTEDGSVEVRVYIAGAERWAMEVSDTGVGIPKEAHSYIFDPFRQVDDSATREYSGAGLGLSIVKQLIDLMGGEIKLESEVGQGSRFTVVLPLAPRAPEEVERSEVVA